MGRIINRFTHDTDIVDFILITRVAGYIASLFWLLSGVGVMVSSTPYAAPVIIIVFIFYALLQRYYRRTSREVQRLDSIR